MNSELLSNLKTNFSIFFRTFLFKHRQKLKKTLIFLVGVISKHFFRAHSHFSAGWGEVCRQGGHILPLQRRVWRCRWWGPRWPQWGPGRRPGDQGQGSLRPNRRPDQEDGEEEARCDAHGDHWCFLLGDCFYRGLGELPARLEWPVVGLAWRWHGH